MGLSNDSSLSSGGINAVLGSGNLYSKGRSRISRLRLSGLMGRSVRRLLHSLIWPRKAYSIVDAVGGLAPGVGNGVMSQGDDVDDCGADGLRPAGGQRNVRDRLVAQWQTSRISLFLRRQHFTRRHSAVKNSCLFGECAGVKLAGPLDPDEVRNVP